MTDEGILVKFMFDGDTKSQTGKFTYEQYENLKSLPITIECEIVEHAEHVLSEKDMIVITEKLRKASARSHTNNLSMNE